MTKFNKIYQNINQKTKTIIENINYNIKNNFIINFFNSNDFFEDFLPRKIIMENYSKLEKIENYYHIKNKIEFQKDKISVVKVLILIELTATYLLYDSIKNENISFPRITQEEIDMTKVFLMYNHFAFMLNIIYQFYTKINNDISSYITLFFKLFIKIFIISFCVGSLSISLQNFLKYSHFIKIAKEKILELDYKTDNEISEQNNALLNNQIDIQIEKNQQQKNDIIELKLDEKINNETSEQNKQKNNIIELKSNN